MKISSKLVNRLLDFLEKATPEQLKENWKHLEEYSKVGPSAIEFVNKQIG